MYNPYHKNIIEHFGYNKIMIKSECIHHKRKLMFGTKF